ncbi:MAG: hypothetical protein Q9M28_02800 [Mariprofundaceae bacterium]|nr:hypothetical protein [Mariprofundaceae bacterium]
MLSRKQVFFRQSILYLLITLLLYALLLWMNHVLRIQSWEIYCSDSVVAQAIEDELQQIDSLDFIQGTPFLLRETLLGRIQALRDIKIVRRLPGSLYIEGVARVPVALWKKGADVLLVDKGGFAYRRLLQGENLSLPLLRAEESELIGISKLILDLKKQAPDYYEHLSECRYLFDGSLKLFFSQRQAWLLPSGEKAHRHLAKLVALLQNRRWRDGNWKVDARQENRWFIRQAQYGGVI